MSLPAPILVITDRTQANRPIAEIAAMICAKTGCEWLLLRDKDLPAGQRRELAGILRGITRRAGTTFSVSADIALAGDCDADGVHLQDIAAIARARAELGRKIVIGYSAHSLSDVEAAHAAGADYVTLSPIFVSASKPGYGPALGLEGLAAGAARMPVLALAGIAPDNAQACLDAGAAGIAVMGGVMRADDPAREITRYRTALGL